MSNKETKIYHIPEQYINSVKAKHNELSDLIGQLSQLERKKQIARLQLWNLLETAVPEASMGNAHLDMQGFTIEVGDNIIPESIIDNLRNRLMGDGE